MGRRTLSVPEAERVRQKIDSLTDKLTHTEIGDILGANQSTVSRILTRRTSRVKRAYAARLASHLGIHISALCRPDQVLARGTGDLIRQWQQAEDGFSRRSAAFRIHNFITELVLTKMPDVSVSSGTHIGLGGDPDSVEVVVTPPGGASFRVVVELEYHPGDQVKLRHIDSAGRVLSGGTLTDKGLNSIFKRDRYDR